MLFSAQIDNFLYDSSYFNDAGKFFKYFENSFKFYLQIPELVKYPGIFLQNKYAGNSNPIKTQVIHN